jgi:hypothetical protein
MSKLKVALDKEMRDACAACFRVIASNNLTEELEEELVRTEIEPGFGVRCQNLIKKLEKKNLERLKK